MVGPGASGAPISVFVSYSHDSPEHSARVRALADRLAGEGFACRLDQYVAPAEGWPRWAARQIREAQQVLVVCSEHYYQRAVGSAEPGVGRGVRWEGHLIYQEIYNADSRNTRFIPVLLASAPAAVIPEPLQGAPFYRPEDDVEYAALVRRLRGEAPAPAPVPREPARVPWLVPLARNPFFTGRGAELETLQARFASEDPGVQALTGLGGVGKSQVAAEYAYRRRAEYDAVFWISGASEVGLERGFARIAEAIGRAGSPDRAALLERVWHWMQSARRWLLVIDDVQSVAQVASFLPPVSSGHVLLTSRLELLDAARVRQPLRLAEMTREQGLELLLARTQREPGAAAAELAAAQRIVQELGALPLALEQAGAYLLKTHATFADYLEGYSKARVRLLEKRGPVQGAYPHSVATTWRLNIDEVDEHTASGELLRLSALLNPEKIPLDLFKGGCVELGPVLAEALHDTSNLALDELLEPLSRYSMIRRDVGARSFSLPRLLQEVVRDGMTEDMRRQGTQRLLRALGTVFPTPEALYVEWQDCDALAAHAEAFVSHLGLAPQLGMDLMIHAGFYLTQRAQYMLAEPLLKAAIAAAEPLGESEHVRLAHAIDRLGWLSYRREQLASAEAQYLRARELRVRALGPRSLEVCHSDCHIAVLYDRLGRFGEAEALYQQILEIGRQTLEPEHEALAIWLANLALLQEHQGDSAGAIATGERAHAIFERHMGPAHPVLAKSFENLGWAHLHGGNPARAEALFRRAFEIRELKFGPASPELARSWSSLASLFASSGSGDAEAALTRALEIREAVLPPSHPDIVASLCQLAQHYAERGGSQRATELYVRALDALQLTLEREHPSVVEVRQRYAALATLAGAAPVTAPGPPVLASPG